MFDFRLKMRKKLVSIVFLSFLFACSTNTINNNNPFLPNYQVNFEINLNLPQYSELKNVTNGVYIANQGIRGIIVFNKGNDQFNIFDAACPNQALSTCSTMSFKKLDANDPLKIDKTKLVCDCDKAEYNTFSGQSVGKEFSMKQYRSELVGSVLRIYN